MKQRILISVSYDGTAYSGWQETKDARSIAGELRDAIFKITGYRSELQGVSRTDAGVHARMNLAVFDCEDRISPEKYKYALNSKLPEDIRVLNSIGVKSDFNPKELKFIKTYKYRIWNSPVENPIERQYRYWVKAPLNIGLMNRGASLLVGEHDFKSFCSVNTQARSTVREILSINVKSQDDSEISSAYCSNDLNEKKSKEIVITVRGYGFLMHMVRIISGTLIDLGRGRFEAERIGEILDLKDRRAAGPTAPAKGLILEEIEII